MIFPFKKTKHGNALVMILLLIMCMIGFFFGYFSYQKQKDRVKTFKHLKIRSEAILMKLTKCREPEERKVWLNEAEKVWAEYQILDNTPKVAQTLFDIRLELLPLLLDVERLSRAEKVFKALSLDSQFSQTQKENFQKQIDRLKAQKKEAAEKRWEEKRKENQKKENAAEQPKKPEETVNTEKK